MILVQIVKLTVNWITKHYTYVKIEGFNFMIYKKGITESVLSRMLEGKGAVLIEGPKGIRFAQY